MWGTGAVVANDAEGESCTCGEKDGEKDGRFLFSQIQWPVPAVAISFGASGSTLGAHGVVPNSRHFQADRRRFRISLPGPKRQCSPTSQRLWAPRISSGLWATLSMAIRSRSKNGLQVHARPREPHQSALHIGRDSDPPRVELTYAMCGCYRGKILRLSAVCAARRGRRSILQVSDTLRGAHGKRGEHQTYAQAGAIKCCAWQMKVENAAADNAVRIIASSETLL